MKIRVAPERFFPDGYGLQRQYVIILQENKISEARPKVQSGPLTEHLDRDALGEVELEPHIDGMSYLTVNCKRCAKPREIISDASEYFVLVEIAYRGLKAIVYVSDQYRKIFAQFLRV